MSALTILIIRHAEKPGGAWPGPGLMDDGVDDTDSLVIRGWQRAGAWSALFGAGLGGSDYPVPRAIYAAAPGSSNDPNDGPSRRPFETVSALAPRLDLTTDKSFGVGEEEKLVNKLLTLEGIVLVAWEHKAIVSEIIPRISVGKGKPPTHWPGHRFDVVLRFDRANGETSFAFRELYPRLMSGDSDKPLEG